MASTKSSSSSNQRKISWWSVATIVIMMVVGILFIVAFAMNQTIVDYIIGTIFLVIGLGLIIFNIIRTGKLLTGGSITGVLALSAGIAQFAGTSLSSVISNIIAWFVFLMGIILFLIGIILLIMNSRKNLVTGIFALVMGTAMGVLGGLMLFPLGNSTIKPEFIWLIAGIVLILFSIYLIVAIFFPNVVSTKVAKRTSIEEKK